MIAAIIATFCLIEQGSLSSRFFPVPTGENGWEEYLRAVDIVSKKEANRLVNYIFYLEPQNNGSLQGDRVALKALKEACDLVREGNRKKLKPLHMADDPDVNILVSRGQTNLAKLFVMEIRAGKASGKPDSAAQSLIDSMTYSNRLGSSLLDVLSANARNALLLSALEDLLPKLSREGAGRLASYFDGIVRAPSPYIGALKLEFAEIVRDPEKHLSEMSEDSEYWTSPEKMSALSPEQRRNYARMIANEFRALSTQIDQVFAKEERFWKLNLSREDPIIEHALLPQLYENIPSLAVRVRTQFRLAALHCRIVEFKRTHNRFPVDLGELVLGDTAYDPASGGPFFYARLTEQSYTLYSLGTAETGRIDLRWRRPQLPN